MTGIILAGGENRRMGTDKAFLAVAGKPLIEHVLAVHQQLFSRTIVVTRSPERYRIYPVLVAEDMLDIRGPLTGIYSGMMRSEDTYHFVSACDMPFLNPGLIRYLGSLTEGYDVVVPRIKGKSEPLHAIYHRRLVPEIKACIMQGHYKVQQLFERAAVRYVTEQEIEPFDPGNDSFRNVNTPAEYKEVVCSDSACRN